MAENYEQVLINLSHLRSQELSIIRLSEPISSLATAQDAPKRNSNASAEAAESATPSMLAADLAHYEEYFKKLRFSYQEQVTKEKFLRSIVGDPPHVVEHQENVELQAQLVSVKAELKAHKVEVAEMVKELEDRGRDLTRRYETVSLQSTDLSTLPSQIDSLRETIGVLKAEQDNQAANPSLSLPLPATLTLLQSREAELEKLNQELKKLQHAVPRKAREHERLENELKPLEAQKAAAIAAAREAMKRKQEGERGLGDDLELKGRWYRGVEVALTDILGVEG